eukprot:g40408.t1
MDVSGESITGDGDGEVHEEEGGVRNGPDDFEVLVEGVGKVDELFELLTEHEAAPIAFNIAKKEARDGASVVVEEGLFHESYKEAGIAQAHVGAYGHPFDSSHFLQTKGKIVEGEDQFRQMNESIGVGVLVGPMGEEEAEGYTCPYISPPTS